MRRALATLGLLAAASACSATRAIVYHPTPVLVPGPAPPALSDEEVAVEDLRFFAEDGVLLHGRLARFRGAQRALLFCHGNRGNVFTPYSEDLQRALRHATR